MNLSFVIYSKQQTAYVYKGREWCGFRKLFNSLSSNFFSIPVSMDVEINL